MMPNDQGKGKYCMRHNTVMGEQSPDIIIGEQGKKNWKNEQGKIKTKSGKLRGKFRV